MADQFADAPRGARVTSKAGAVPPVPDVKALARRANMLSAVMLVVWMVPAVALFPLARHLARDGGVNAPVMVIIAFYVMSMAMMAFMLGVFATRKRAARGGPSFLLWHAALWSLFWIAGTAILAQRVARWGWHGGGWVEALGAVAVLGGVPVGYRSSIRYLNRIAETRAVIARAQERRREAEANSLRSAAIREAFQQEHARTTAAIKDRQARGEVDAHYVFAAFTAMSHLSDNAGQPPDLDAMTTRLREMRLKVEAGAPLA